MKNALSIHPICILGLRIIVTTLLLLDTLIANADIYERIEDSGEISYSDSPVDDNWVLIIKEPSLIKQETASISNTPLITPDANKSTSKLLISTPADLLQYIQNASNIHQVDQDLIHAVIHVESAYRKNAQSTKGAVGLMQLMPATAKRMGVIDIYNPVQNIEGGTKYLRHLLKMFDNDIRLTLAAYNAGEQSVLRYGKRVPPFKETQEYVPKVIQVYEALQKRREKLLIPL